MRALALIALLFVSACGDRSVMEEVERNEAKQTAAAAAQVAASQHFLAQVRAEQGVEARPSGLLISFTRRAPARSAATAPQDAVVLVHYEGKLADGTVFDSSYGGQPAQFPVSGVVPGFSEAIQMMRPGDAVVATMPAELGYGAAGSPPAIPPNAALQFRIELLAYHTTDGRTVYAPGTAPRPAH
jgi:FKBP-type peptidyl-prolyl cis-trans isomerase